MRQKIPFMEKLEDIAVVEAAGILCGRSRVRLARIGTRNGGAAFGGLPGEPKGQERKSGVFAKTVGQPEGHRVIKLAHPVIPAENREGNPLAVGESAVLTAGITADSGADRTIAKGHQRKRAIGHQADGEGISDRLRLGQRKLKGKLSVAKTDFLAGLTKRMRVGEIQGPTPADRQAGLTGESGAAEVARPSAAYPQTRQGRKQLCRLILPLDCLLYTSRCV